MKDMMERCVRSFLTLVAFVAVFTAMAAVADVGVGTSPLAQFDVRRPEIVLLQSPAPGVYRAGDELPIRWSVAEDHVSTREQDHAARILRDGVVLEEQFYPDANGEYQWIWTVPELSLGDVYVEISVTDLYGNVSTLESSRFVILASTTDIGLPSAVARLTATPNPFNPSTRIDLSMPNAGPLRLAAYDLLGRRVRTLFNGDSPAGIRSLDWDGRDDAGRALPAGAYVLRMDATGSTLNRKVVLLP